MPEEVWRHVRLVAADTIADLVRIAAPDVGRWCWSGVVVALVVIDIAAPGLGGRESNSSGSSPDCGTGPTGLPQTFQLSPGPGLVKVGRRTTRRRRERGGRRTTRRRTKGGGEAEAHALT